MWVLYNEAAYMGNLEANYPQVLASKDKFVTWPSINDLLHELMLAR